ncbi:MAG: glycosyltransferase [Patescibacteria group bacterium]|nr:glycosyltransferase [Patescibacteria group bacterium]
MKKIFFSIVIPTLNEEKNLSILLSSIKNQNYKNYQVIIVDSFSKDKTKEIALNFKKQIPLLFLQRKNKNVAQARNFGAKNAKKDFLIFFDADVEIGEKNFLEEINKKIQKYNLDALTVWNRAKKGIKGKIIFFLMNLAMSLFEKIKPSANGPCIIIKKTFFDKVKGFDEQIIFGEDFELIQRLVKNKAKFKVFSYPILYVSTRRFEKEGIIKSLYKSIKAILYQLFFGPIKKPIFDYQMGGEYYKNIKN